jgi:CRP/FNR family cyclic AMP-dependent transcriptional regulator
MKEQKFKPGDTIIAEGTFGEQTFLITKGEVLICKETGKARIPIALLKEGEVFGEMYLLDNTGFRSATVIAQSEVEVDIISREEMEKYLKETPPIILSMTKTLSSRLAVASQEISMLKFQNSSWFVRKLCEIFQQKPIY